MVLLAGCRPPEVVEEETGEFTAKEWEELTEDLLRYGREGNIEAFKAHVAPETVLMFEESWGGIRAKCDKGLESELVSEEDKDRLLQVKQGCTWEALAKNYRPGQLMTITKEEGGYRVKEIIGGGRKVDYLVRRGGGGWVVEYEEDSRTFRQIEAVAHALVNSILEKHGV